VFELSNLYTFYTTKHLSFLAISTVIAEGGLGFLLENIMRYNKGPNPVSQQFMSLFVTILG
jgi:hypothetical protein